MKTLILSLALSLTATTVEASPSKTVIVAKHHLDNARTALKQARATDRAQRKATSKARKLAKLQAQIAKLRAADTARAETPDTDVETDPADY